MTEWNQWLSKCLCFSVAAHSEHAHDSEWSDSTAGPRSQYAVRRAARSTHAEPDERTDARYIQRTHRQTPAAEENSVHSGHLQTCVHFLD